MPRDRDWRPAVLRCTYAGMQRRPLLAMAAASVLAPRVGNAASGPVLVELFTSQGCSSCPSADAAFGRLLGRADVIAIAFHVTYWDHLGWRDTLGAPAFTDRQRWYAGLLGKGLYTPQLVLDGELDLVGSDPRLDQALNLVRSAATHPEDRDLGRRGGAGARGRSDRRRSAHGHRLRSAEPGGDRRGENAGASIDYYNAARTLTDLGAWDGGSRRIALSAELGSGVAVVAQDQATGRVIALGRRKPSEYPPPAIKL